MRLIYLLLIFSLKVCFTFANEWEFKAEQITTNNNDQIIIGDGNAEAIFGNEFKIFAKKIIYYREIDKILAMGSVKMIDISKNILINSEHVEFNRPKKIVFSKSKTIFEFQDDIKLNSSDVIYDLKQNTISSKKETKITDLNENILNLKQFKYNHLNKELFASDIKFIDKEKNEYNLKKGIIKLNENNKDIIKFDEKNLLGKDVEIFLNPNNSSNQNNNSRLKGNSLKISNNKSKIKKGVFTSCKSKNDNCPPWKITSKEIIHDIDKKQINHKSSWLSLYNVPVLYFPKFFHPDPTVERQSGFLIPQMNNSKKLGNSFKLPYFHVISNNTDLTFSPRIFSESEGLMQAEYRTVNKNSSHIIDFSLSNDESVNKNSKTHFFSNSIFNLSNNIFENSSLFLKIQRTSMDNYIDIYGLRGSSPLIENEPILENAIEFTGENENTFFETSLEIYEKMNQSTNDRYEYVYPNYYLSKNFDFDMPLFNGLDIISYGNQKKFSTNIYEASQINDLIFSIDEFFSFNSINDNLKFIIKNVNTNGKNSDKYKNQTQSELMSNIIYDFSIPLKKIEKKFTKYLIPRASLRYSPNSTKNIQSLDRKLDITNLYSLNRIGTNDDIEGGASLTISNKFKIEDQNKDTLLDINIGTVFNDGNKKQLPSNNSLRNSQSDFVGNINYKPIKNFEFNYNFSADNQINTVNLHQFKNEIRINNFINTFEFYEENNEIGLNSHFSNTLGFEIDDSKKLLFRTRKNKKTNLTEFYDMIYEYKNDCLTASIKYKKEFYSNSVLEPSENLFFTLTLIPLGSTSADNILK